jgi:hemolysin D
LIQTLEERVGVRETALKRDVGTKINVFDARESLQKSQSQLAADKGQLIETDAAMEELASQKVRAASQFIADNETKLADADRKSDELAQQYAKGAARLARTKLVAPIDGIVQQMAVTTIGQVVTTGQQLMLIAPQGGALRAEVFVSNADIAFVKRGQVAEIKIDAFPFTKYGTIQARVEKIAADAIEEQEAKRLQANALAPANSGASNPANTPGQPQNFVFPVTLQLSRATLPIGEVEAPLTPGMTIQAEIKTDQRRVIDYLLSPLSRISSEAMRER